MFVLWELRPDHKKSIRFLFTHSTICNPNMYVIHIYWLFTASDLTSITSRIHSWVLFLLWLHPFILSGVISHWSPVACWAPTDLGSSSFSVLSFSLFILFMGFSRQEYWDGLLFPFPVDHIPSIVLLVVAKNKNKSPHSYCLNFSKFSRHHSDLKEILPATWTHG